jgi:hypothetical protein
MEGMAILIPATDTEAITILILPMVLVVSTTAVLPSGSGFTAVVATVVVTAADTVGVTVVAIEAADMVAITTTITKSRDRKHSLQIAQNSGGQALFYQNRAFFPALPGTRAPGKLSILSEVG